MKLNRYVFACVALILWSGLDFAQGPGKVLVPGNPPLTQETVDLYQQMWEWYCDVKLTPEQRRQHTQHFINFWKMNGPAVTNPLQATYRRMEKEWRGYLDLKGADQERMRIKVRNQWMNGLRKSADAPGRFLVSVFDAAYKPGGPKNPILVDGEPPLTEVLVNTYREFCEYLLGINVSADGRKTFQALVVADWKAWDRAARNDFLKQLAEWEMVSKKGGQFAYRAKLLPSYLDRQGDPKKTSSSERWMLETYQSLYKKRADEQPVARMDKQPRPHQALPGKNGFPADPKHQNIFTSPTVFTQSEIFSRNWGVDFYVERNTGKSHMSYQYWWFLPTGRFYTRNIRCLGSERVKGTEKDIIVSSYYLTSMQVTESWGRYKIDDKDRIQMETDKGEKILLHLTYGRRQLNWRGTVYDAPPRKKK